MTSFEPIDPMLQSERPLLALRPGTKDGFLPRVVRHLSRGRIATPNAIAFTLLVLASIVVILMVLVLVSNHHTASQNDQGIEQHGGRSR